MTGKQTRTVHVEYESILRGRSEERIRPLGIDCPGKGDPQPCMVPRRDDGRAAFDCGLWRVLEFVCYRDTCFYAGGGHIHFGADGNRERCDGRRRALLHYRWHHADRIVAQVQRADDRLQDGGSQRHCSCFWKKHKRSRQRGLRDQSASSGHARILARGWNLYGIDDSYHERRNGRSGHPLHHRRQRANFFFNAIHRGNYRLSDGDAQCDGCCIGLQRQWCNERDIYHRHSSRTKCRRPNSQCRRGGNSCDDHRD